ncbi:hypothetical protein CDL15_Pgr010015 [Punica granatum]|uniref:Phospholipid/glycerol acyltransferase domain-containing protein n=2 Tax=Punica granatum TaxID=22663 RepID=A0A218X504_PUNGR|nr:hypothetical protein CDL15_Pgr010015 [Punica granatum]
MFPEVFFFKSIVYFLYRILLGKLRSNNPRGLHRKASTAAFYHNHLSKCQKFSSLAHKPNLPCHTVVFDLEGALLRSSSPFPYFMLVAFEAGSFVRALVLLLLYPLIALLGGESGLKVMVFVSFFGVKVRSFRGGSAVLPKFFMEDVGLEGFEVLRRAGKKVGVSGLPQVMVEGFLRDYLEVDVVVGRELKVFCGYFLGIMEERKRNNGAVILNFVDKEILGDEAFGGKFNNSIIGVSSFKTSLNNHIFSHCKGIYIVSRGEKRSWRPLPSHSTTKPVIFHDGRLALRPLPLAALALFMWVPFGIVLSILRIAIGVSLPHNLSIPILIFSGLRHTVWIPIPIPGTPAGSNAIQGQLYVCNHRTLLDPLYLSFTLKKELTAVTYSLSRVSEILSPIKTVRLTRDRVKDRAMMESLLRQGDLVVCPEGTTCREPYLLRFSPLFAEMSDEIVPVAVNTSVEWFHGTTAGGLKCFDPLFFMMNPSPCYSLRLLEKVSGLSTISDRDGERSRFDVANEVQQHIGSALGFECTGLTRRDKYMILAGNEGIVNGTK